MSGGSPGPRRCPRYAASAALVAALLTWVPGVCRATPEPPPASYALVNGTIIDGTGAPPVRGGVLIVRDGKIAACGAAGAIPVPADIEVYDLAGRTVLPGFIDAHVHGAYEPERLRRWLQGGVTTVRDLGPFFFGDHWKRRDALNEAHAGARLIGATPILTAPGGYGALSVPSPEEGERMVRGFLLQGADLIKIAVEDQADGRRWRALGAPEIRSMVETAHQQGARVSAHVTRARNLSLVVDAGVDDIAHMVTDPLDDATIRAVVARGIYWVPTLELWDAQAAMTTIRLDRTAIENLGRFHRAGGKVALGTDVGNVSPYARLLDPGFPIREVRLMARAGMSPMDIIVAGTRNAAVVCGKAAELGTLEPGKKADILILNGNPLESLDAFVSPHLVIQEGRFASGEQRAAGGGRGSG